MYELLTPPAVEPVSLTDLKAAMRIDHDRDDQLVTKLGVTARAFIERRLGAAFAEQTWTATTQGLLTAPLRLRPSPVASVTSVEVRYGTDGVFAPTTEWKLTQGIPSSVEITAPAVSGGEQLCQTRVTFTAGRADVSSTPAEAMQAILLLAAHYYENREAVVEGRYVSMPLSVETLIQGLREVQL